MTAVVVIWWTLGLGLVAGATHWVMGLVESWVYARRVEVTPRRAQRDLAAIGRGTPERSVMLSADYPSLFTPNERREQAFTKHRPGHPDYRCTPGNAGQPCICEKCQAPKTYTLTCPPGVYVGLYFPATGGRAPFTPVHMGAEGQIVATLSGEQMHFAVGDPVLVEENKWPIPTSSGVGWRPDVGWIEFGGKRARTIVEDWAGNVHSTLMDQYINSARPSGVLYSDKPLTAEAQRRMQTAWKDRVATTWSAVGYEEES